MDMLDEIYNKVTPKAHRYTKPKRISPSRAIRKVLDESAEVDNLPKFHEKSDNFTESKQPLASTRDKESFKVSANQKEVEPLRMNNVSRRSQILRAEVSRRASASMRKILMQMGHDPSIQTSDYNPNRSPPDWEKVKLHTVSSKCDTTDSKQSR